MSTYVRNDRFLRFLGFCFIGFGVLQLIIKLSAIIGINNVFKGITVTALIARRTSNEEKRIE